MKGYIRALCSDCVQSFSALSRRWSWSRSRSITDVKLEQTWLHARLSVSLSGGLLEEYPTCYNFPKPVGYGHQIHTLIKHPPFRLFMNSP